MKRNRAARCERDKKGRRTEGNICQKIVFWISLTNAGAGFPRMCPGSDDRGFLDVFRDYKKETCGTPGSSINKICTCTNKTQGQAAFFVDCPESHHQSNISEAEWKGILQALPPDTTHLSLKNQQALQWGIPEHGLAHLSELEYLDLRSPYWPVINRSLSGLTSLRVLLIDGDPTTSYLPDLIYVLQDVASTLTYLHLEVKYEFLASDLASLKAFVKLRTLVYQCSLFSFFEPWSMRQLKELVCLKDDDFWTTPVNITFSDYAKNLRCLNLSHVFFRMGIVRFLSPFRSLSKLTALDLNGNEGLLRTHTVCSLVKGLRLHFLNTANMETTYYNDDDCEFVGTVRYYIADHNEIDDPGDFLQYAKSLRSLSAAHNLLSVPIELHHLNRMKSSSHPNVYDTIEHLDYRYQSPDVSCDVCSEGKLDIELPPKLHSLLLGHYSGSDMTFLKHSEITIVNNGSLALLDLSYMGWLYLTHPIRCAPDVVISIQNLNLEGNQMLCVHPEYFTTCNWTSLKTLRLAYNNLGLHVSECDLQNQNPLAFLESLSTLEYLDLSGNQISVWNTDISKLNNLRHLKLTKNPLRCMPQAFTRNLDSFNAKRLNDTRKNILLSLEHTNLKCSCDCLDFFIWLRSTKVDVLLPDLPCELDNGDTVSFTNRSDIVRKMEGLCFVPSARFITNSVLVFLSWNTVVIAATLGFRFRHTVRYLWLRMRVDRRTLAGILRRRKQYDAFVSCTGSDAVWVLRELLPHLETNDTGLRFCVAQRNFLVGSSIMDNIVNAIHQSHKIILVVSQEFLNSGWCVEEMLMAHQESLERGENIIICVFMADVEKRHLPSRLRWMVRHVTCIKWPPEEAAVRRIFWAQLQRAILEGIPPGEGNPPREGDPRPEVNPYQIVQFMSD